MLYQTYGRDDSMYIKVAVQALQRYQYRPLPSFWARGLLTHMSTVATGLPAPYLLLLFGYPVLCIPKGIFGNHGICPKFHIDTCTVGAVARAR